MIFRIFDNLKTFCMQISILLFITSNLLLSNDCYSEIHCKHFFFGMPIGVPNYNDLIIRDSYALSSNDSTKFADWVAYVIDSASINGISIERKWKADTWLDDKETLEPSDYKEANKSYHYDRGHQAPLANFKGNRDIETSNYLSNITPQKADLNQGTWKELEEIERRLIGKFKIIYVMTGPLYEMEYPPLPNADERHKVPSGYWKIIAIPLSPNKFQSFGFIMNQNTSRKSELSKHLCTIREIEKRSKLDFFSDLPRNEQDIFENKIDSAWYEQNFK